MFQKPFIKWVGGKTQIIQSIMDKFPSEMNNYHELFVGGGSVLLALLSMKQSGDILIKGKIYAYDLNEHLINIYNQVKSNKDELFEIIMSFKNEYISIEGTEVNRKPTTPEEAHTSKESYYYWLRSIFNSLKENNTTEHAALFIVLNKLCFRGLYREGPNGFNVPFGHYKTTPAIITKKELDTISDMFQCVEFIHCGFDESITNPTKGDFVYADPPYVPESKTSFVKYTQKGFDSINHESLFDKLKDLTNKDVKFVMSNSNTDYVNESFEGFQIEKIVAKRAINSKKPQSTAMEVIINN